MPKIIVSGCNGHMGQAVVKLAEEMEDVQISCGFNRTPAQKNGFCAEAVSAQEKDAKQGQKRGEIMLFHRACLRERMEGSLSV